MSSQYSLSLSLSLRTRKSLACFRHFGPAEHSKRLLAVKKQEPKIQVASIRNKLFTRLRLVKLSYMKLVFHNFISHAPYLFLTLIVLQASKHLSAAITATDLYDLWNQILRNPSAMILSSIPLVLAAMVCTIWRPRPVYLVDFSCCKPGEAHKVTMETIVRQFMLNGTFTEETVGFLRRMLERSGQGQATYLPSSLLSVPLNPCAATAREEATTVMFATIDELLKKTAVRAKDIGVLVVNCSLYSPAPSLSAMIVNRYKLRGNVKSYSLGGMGCSAGLISIDLAKRLLQVHQNSYALIVSTENITLNGYFGNNRSMLVTNSLFRMGGGAVLLSSRPSDRNRSKYELVHTVRTNKGAEDRCYNCVLQEEDDAGNLGVTLSKDLMVVAGEALKTNITTLGPLVLPMSEQLLFLATVILKKVFKVKMKPYIPDFKLAFEHFCIHAGGRAVLDELEKNLDLSSWHMEPSRMTLYRFGNTSSSSLWYELAYCEAKGRIKKGHRLWQIAFGSGFKCNSAVWRALRTVEPSKENPWIEEMNELPVQVPKTVLTSTS